MDPSLPADKRLQTEKKIQAALLIDPAFILPENSAKQLPAIRPSDLFLGAFQFPAARATPNSSGGIAQSWTSAFAAQSQVFHFVQRGLPLPGRFIGLHRQPEQCHSSSPCWRNARFGKNRSPRTWSPGNHSPSGQRNFHGAHPYRLLLHALDEPLEQISALVSCGAKMDFQTARQLTERFTKLPDFANTTEPANWGMSVTLPLPIRRKYPDSIGKLFPGGARVPSRWLDLGGQPLPRHRTSALSQPLAT